MPLAAAAPGNHLSILCGCRPPPVMGRVFSPSRLCLPAGGRGTEADASITLGSGAVVVAERTKSVRDKHQPVINLFDVTTQLLRALPGTLADAQARCGKRCTRRRSAGWRSGLSRRGCRTPSRSIL
jgi:hypothetical protein